MTEMVLTRKKIGTREIVQIGMLAAIATILTLVEFPLGFAPPFYELDFSEVPILMGAFAISPVAGVIIELIKILLNLCLNGTDTAFVGEFANFLIGVSFVLPAALIYHRKKNRSHALAGMITGTVTMTVIGCILNAYLLLPAYAKAFHMPIEGLIAAGTEVNGSIDSLLTFVLFAVAPFNLLKGVLVTLLTFLLYKKISIILKGNHY